MKYLMFALFFISIQHKLRQHTHLVGHHVIPHANFGGCQRGRYRQVLDMQHVASRLGEASPDLNGDGVVNILDLTLIANQIGN